MKKINILAIIPARSGSKGIKDKNIYEFKSKPLMFWTFNAAKQSKLLDKVIFSSNSKKYISIAKENGIDAPFLRPNNISSDITSSAEVVIHALDWVEKKLKLIPTYILYLQPTSPLRTFNDIDNSILIAKKNNADSVISVNKTDKHPYFLKELNSQGKISHYMPMKNPTPRRQELEQYYVLNGAIFLVKTKFIKQGDWYGKNSFAYVMPKNRSIDIDSLDDIKLANFYINNL